MLASAEGSLASLTKSRKGGSHAGTNRAGLHRVNGVEGGEAMTEQQLKRIIREVIREELAVITRNVVPETLTQEEAAKTLGVLTSTLSAWRSTGKGPKFMKCGGRVMYLASDINDYIEKGRVNP